MSMGSPGSLSAPGHMVLVPMAQAGEAICDKSPEPGSRAHHVHVLHEKQHFFFPKALQNQILNKNMCEATINLPLSFALEEHSFPLTSLIKEDEVSETSQLSFIS